MQKASEFAEEWADTIIANAKWSCGGIAGLWGREVPDGYLGTMACEIDEVLNDLMRKMGDDWARIHDLDSHAPGDICNLYAGESSFHFIPTMTRNELFNELRRLALWAGLK